MFPRFMFLSNISAKNFQNRLMWNCALKLQCVTSVSFFDSQCRSHSTVILLNCVMHCEKKVMINIKPFVILFLGKRNLCIVDEKTVNYARFPFARAHSLNVSRYAITNCKMSFGPVINKFTLCETIDK